MKNVVSINRDRFLGSYIDAQNARRIPEPLLEVGVVLAAALPQLFLGTYGGSIVLLTLTVVALAGSVWGLEMYNRPPEPPASFSDTGRTTRHTPGADGALDKAA